MPWRSLTYFPLFQGITHFVNPALERALGSAPVTVVADPAECSFQLKLTNTEKYTTSCDIAKSVLVSKSVNYENVAAATSGAPAEIRIGETVIPSFNAAGLSPDDLKAKTAAFEKAVGDAIVAAGYPSAADPTQINYPMAVLLLTILVIYVTMVYGPIAAWLVEMFPTRIRYTGMSLPYHIGNGWFGGFLPAIVFAIVAATGNIYSGLWYPIVVAAMSFVVALFFLPETKDRDIETWDGDHR